MKKSEILEVLGNDVKFYERIGNYLHVQVKEIKWEKLVKLHDYMLAIMPVDTKTIEISFDSSVIFD